MRGTEGEKESKPIFFRITMGRPKACSSIRDFAALFASSVTVGSSLRYDWVARTGKHTIFVLLSRLAPKVKNPHLTNSCPYVSHDEFREKITDDSDQGHQRKKPVSSVCIFSYVLVRSTVAHCLSSRLPIHLQFS